MIKHCLIPLLIALLSSTGIASEVDLQEDNPHPIRIGVLDNNPPWIYRQNNQLTGVGIDRYKTMFSNLQIPIETHSYDNLVRPISDLLAVRIDLATIISNKDVPFPTLENVICASKPIGTSHVGIYRPATSTDINVRDFSDLKQYKIGLTRFVNLKYAPYLDKENIVQVKSPEYLVKMLKAKRIDIVFLGQGVAKYWSNKYQSPLQKLLHAGTFDVTICLSEISMGKEASASLKNRIDHYLTQNPIPDYNLFENENNLKHE